MPHRLKVTRVPGQAGVSLVEVVIGVVILAVLAAVVVFAVRDFSLQGTTSDCKTDTRTLRIAADAYAGSVVGAGQYTADETELAATGFLKKPSNLHDLVLKDPTDPRKGVNITVQAAKCGAVGTVVDGTTSF